MSTIFVNKTATGAFSKPLTTMMTHTLKKGNPWRKSLWIIFIVLIIIGAGIYWYVATEKFADTKDRAAAFTVNANDFIREFIADDSAANKKYREKIIVVNGRISELEAPDTTTVNIKFIEPSSGAYVIFAFQEQHLGEARGLNVGDSVSVKGSCSGVAYSSILEVPYVSFKRSTLNK